MSKRALRLRNASGEEGNVLFLGLGVALVALLLIMGLAHVGALYLDKKRLGYVADGAALVYSDTAMRNAYFAGLSDGQENDEIQEPLTAAQTYAGYVAGRYGLRNISISTIQNGSDVAIHASALASSVVGTPDGEQRGRFVTLHELGTARSITTLR